ncbi:MAG: hypothetical protein JW748_07710 [Anaerolineales bacterium]|nr:hypothetical protein [Anaerolineales bacterium]
MLIERDDAVLLVSLQRQAIHPYLFEPHRDGGLDSFRLAIHPVHPPLDTIHHTDGMNRRGLFLLRPSFCQTCSRPDGQGNDHVRAICERTRKIPPDDIRAFALYRELILDSLKIILENHEILSIVSIK